MLRAVCGGIPRLGIGAAGWEMMEIFFPQRAQMW